MPPVLSPLLMMSSPVSNSTVFPVASMTALISSGESTAKLESFRTSGWNSADTGGSVFAKLGTPGLVILAQLCCSLCQRRRNWRC